MPHGYLRVLGLPGAAAFFLTAATGRLGIAMYGLGVTLAALSGYHDYVRAGLAGGAFAVGEVAGGLTVGRLSERLGQRRLLIPLACLHAAAMAALILALAHPAPIWLTAAIAVPAGGYVPPLGAFAAARWSRLLHGDPRVESAFALESVTNDLVFLTGPALVAVLPGGLPIAAALVTASALLLAAQPRTEPSRSAPPLAAPPLAAPPLAAPPEAPPTSPADSLPRARLLKGWRRPRPLVVRVGLANLLLGVLFGTTRLATTALADGTAEAGLYYLAMNVGSLAASAAYGLVTWRSPVSRRFLAAALLIVIGAVALLVFPGYAALIVLGLGVGPLVVLSATVLEKRAGPSELTGLFALMGALSAAGAGLAGLAAGPAIAYAGATGGFTLLLAYGVGLAAIALTLRESPAR